MFLRLFLELDQTSLLVWELPLFETTGYDADWFNQQTRLVVELDFFKIFLLTYILLEIFWSSHIVYMANFLPN